MRRWLVLAGAFFWLGSVSGCGGESHDKLVQDMIKTLDRATESLEKIRDAKDPVDEAKRQKEALRKAGEELQQLRNRAENLKEPLDPEEKERLAAAYKEKFDAALKKATDTWKQIEHMPKGKQIRRELEDALANFGFSK